LLPKGDRRHTRPPRKLRPWLRGNIPQAHREARPFSTHPLIPPFLRSRSVMARRRAHRKPCSQPTGFALNLCAQRACTNRHASQSTPITRRTMTTRFLTIMRCAVGVRHPCFRLVGVRRDTEKPHPFRHGEVGCDPIGGRLGHGLGIVQPPAFFRASYSARNAA
jgi:hypothetical protein